MLAHLRFNFFKDIRTNVSIIKVIKVFNQNNNRKLATWGRNYIYLKENWMQQPEDQNCQRMREVGFQ